jgi:hypothetical protein
VISLNALLGRPVEYYEYPWAIEGRLRSAQSRLRSLFQASDVVFIFSKSMPSERASLRHRMPHLLFRAGSALLRLLPAGMLPPHSLRSPAWGRKGQPLFHAEEPRFRLPRFSEAQRSRRLSAFARKPAAAPRSVANSARITEAGMGASKLRMRPFASKA